jgi:hypothetical protein
MAESGVSSGIYFDKINIMNDKPNFFKGEDHAFRQNFPSLVLEECWKCIPTSVREILRLKP